MHVLNFIKDLIEKIKKYLEKVFRKKKKKNTVRISILTIVLFLLSSSFAQRPNLVYFYAHFTQDSLFNVEQYTIRWYNGIEDSLTFSLSDTNSLSVWFNGTWRPYQLGMNTDSIRILVDNPINFNLEYTFAVVAKNATGKSAAATVDAYFIVSDVNIDNTVDGLDLMKLAKKWGYGNLSYRDWEDINGDSYVDGLDLIQLSRDWGRTWTP